MRKFLIGCAAAALVVSLSACGGSGDESASQQTLQHEADMYAISEIEKTFHEAMTKKDIDQMMSLFAPNATATFGPGKTVTGKDQIREVWLNSVAFQPKTNWLSDHPAYKLKATVDGDRGHAPLRVPLRRHPQPEVAAVTAANQDVARIDNRWLITNFVGSTSELKV